MRSNYAKLRSIVEWQTGLDCRYQRMIESSPLDDNGAKADEQYELKLRRRDKTREDNTLFSRSYFPNPPGSFSSHDPEMQSQQSRYSIPLLIDVVVRRQWPTRQPGSSAKRPSFSDLGVDASLIDFKFSLTFAYCVIVLHFILSVLDAQTVAYFAVGVFATCFGHRAGSLQSWPQAIVHSAPGCNQGWP